MALWLGAYGNVELSSGQLGDRLQERKLSEEFNPFGVPVVATPWLHRPKNKKASSEELA